MRSFLRENEKSSGGQSGAGKLNFFAALTQRLNAASSGPSQERDASYTQPHGMDPLGERLKEIKAELKQYAPPPDQQANARSRARARRQPVRHIVAS